MPDYTEKLRIATTGGYPPFTYVDNAGEIAGFDIDIALALCAELGAECDVVLEEWERLIPELRASSFDAIAASMSITEKRRQLVSFTDRYYSNVVRFVARKGSGFDPANPAGKTIGASRTTIASDWLEANLAGTATIKLYTGQQLLLRPIKPFCPSLHSHTRDPMAGRQSRDDPTFETCQAVNAHETGQFHAPLQNAPPDPLMNSRTVTRFHVLQLLQNRSHPLRQPDVLFQLLRPRPIDK